MNKFSSASYPSRRVEPGRLLVDLLNRRKRVGLAGGFLGPVTFDTGEPERKPPGVLGALLNLVEGNLDHELGAYIHGVRIPGDLQFKQRFRLPCEHLVRQAFERLAQHDESAALGIPRAEMEVAQRAST